LSSEDFKIAVIGAGPVGLFFALELLKRGIIVDVFEEHSRIGVPKHCAGVVSIGGLNKLCFSDGKYVLNKVRGALIHSPSGKYSLKVARRDFQAYILDREAFDQNLYYEATSRGVRVFLNSFVKDVTKTNRKTWRIAVGKGSTREYDLIVDAEGASLKIARSLGVRVPKDARLPAIQFELKGIQDIDEDFVEVFLGNRWAHGFFAWLVPLCSTEARVGLASYTRPRIMLDYLLHKHPLMRNRVKRAKIKEVNAGLVIVSGPAWRFFGDGYIMVGDAAGHVKPTTGGGIVFGMLGAKVAAEVIQEALKSGDFSRAVLKKYSELWERNYGGEFKAMKMARRIFTRLDDSKLESLIKALSREDFLEVIEKFGDMDFQRSVISRILLSPRFLFSLLKAFLA